MILFQFSQPHTLLGMFFRPGALATGVLLACFSRTRLWVPCEPTGLSKSATARATVLVLPIILMGALGADQFHISGVHIGLIALLGRRARLGRQLRSRRGWSPGPCRGASCCGSAGAPTASISSTFPPLPRHGKSGCLCRRPERASTAGSHSAFLLTAAVLICALAEANHRFVEQPLRRRGNRIAADFARRPLPS